MLLSQQWLAGPPAGHPVMSREETQTETESVKRAAGETCGVIITPSFTFTPPLNSDKTSTEIFTATPQEAFSEKLN